MIYILQRKKGKKEGGERGREEGIGRMCGWRERKKQLLVDVL